MIFKDLLKYVDHETSWLKSYGLIEERKKDLYNDTNFYERLQRVHTNSRTVALPLRCAAVYITSKKPVLESTIEELECVSGPRNHQINVYTPLEYFFAKNIEGCEDLKAILRS